MKSAPRRGQIFYADLEPTRGREQAGHRPVLVLSVEPYNEKLRVAVVMLLTTKGKWPPPLQVALGVVDGRQSHALPGQVRSVDLSRLERQIGSVGDELVERCLDALVQICGRRPKNFGGGAANDG